MKSCNNLKFSALVIALAVQIMSASSVGADLSTPTSSPVPNTGWRLWLDPGAQYLNDTLYLPEDVDLSKIPANPPTGGWATLNSTAGIAVSLPGTVEEHYWGIPPSDPVNPADPNNVVTHDACYKGVSWWYRTFVPPALGPGEHLIFSFPGARLRAEVYVNDKLVGYDVVGETQFDADVTDAIIPGKTNTLAVRITNIGGEHGWGDTFLMTWGQYRIPVSHYFGGLDGGITMNIRGPVAVTDLAALNNPDPKSITLSAEVTSGGAAYSGPVALNISKDGQTIWSGSASVNVPAGGKSVATTTVSVPSAVLWDIGKPNLYLATASVPTVPHSDRSTTFGFRWFTATGVGANAELTLNGRRIVVKSAISWGFFAPNGMFPDQAAANRDAAAVQAIGLNCVQNHRHMPKPIILSTYDTNGIMMYCEPGDGLFTFTDNTHQGPPADANIDTSGQGGEPTTFYNKYEMDKLLSTIKTNRSHPSVIIWSLQNEISPDLHNPKIFYTLRQMKAIDPSRIILLKSGVGFQNQAWSLPYSDTIQYDTGTGVSGWHDEHTALLGTGVYVDSFYNSPTDHTYFSNITNEISMWGEMATGASPDDHGKIAAWYKANGLTGYDSSAHQEVNSGYEKFLDTYHLRSAFPTAEDVFRGAEDMHYYTAARMLENGRICDANDYLALSGWESTVVDDHSGLVDELRNPKTDPTPIKEAAAPAVLVIRAVHYVIAQGDPTTIDIHLVNENILKGDYTLTVSASDANGKTFHTSSYPVTVAGGDIFAQLLKEGIVLAPKQDGYVTITASLAIGHAPPVLTRTARIYVVNVCPAPIRATVAALGPPKFFDALKSQFGTVATAPADTQNKVDDIIIDPFGGARSTWSQSASHTGDIKIATDPNLYTQHMYGGPGKVARFPGIANGMAKVDLIFLEPQFSQAGQREFDVALNGQTVLHNLDIAAEAGGKDIPLVKSFIVQISDGTLDLSVPAVATGDAMFTAIRITDSKKQITAVIFSKHDYHDSTGQHWVPVALAGMDWSCLTPELMRRVHNDGTRLVILSDEADALDIDGAATELARLGLVTYTGLLGDSSATWMGRWYFAKPHWLLAGLPTDCVLNWEYQITGGNGILLNAPGIDAVIGYGVNHSPTPALGAAVIPYGKGQIVLFCIPGLAPSFTTGTPLGVDPITASRIIYNCLSGPQLRK